MIETAQKAFERIATRVKDHPRKVYESLSDDQATEVVAAICKNNLEHDGRVPDIFNLTGATVQDDTEVFAKYCVIGVRSGGYLVIEPMPGGFTCRWCK